MESLLEFFESFEARGAEVAVRQRRGYRMESHTYAQIAADANRVARELEGRGLAKGDAAVLWGGNSADWVTAFFGCLLRGVIVVPIDHGSSAEFATRVAGDVNAKLAFVSHGSDPVGGVATIELDSLRESVAIHDGGPYSAATASRSDTLEIIYTSGTTAEPRGVVISHGNVLANIAPIQREVQKYLKYERFFHPIRFLNLLPLSHVFGQMLGVFIPPLIGGTVVFLDSPKPTELAAAIRRERVSVLVAVPRFIESLQREIEEDYERADRQSQFEASFTKAANEKFLRRWWTWRRVHARLGWKFWSFISGGAALPENTETFWNRLGYAVIQGYGMTETTSLITLNHPFRSDKGSIGTTFPGMEVRVDDNGEILVRGENVATSYRQNGETHSVAGGDGWFRTGDIAEKDAEGRLFFKGRSKNVIVTSSGMNVYPEDLEKALRAQPEIRDCVVLGMERDGNAEACAALILNEASDPRAAMERANASLADYQKMRDWFVWPEKDFPRTSTQKPILPAIRTAIQSAAKSETKSLHAVSADSIASLVARITKRPVDAVAGSAGLESDLNLSSLDRVEVLSAIEQRYQVELSDAQFQQVNTMKQLEALVQHGTRTPVQHAYPRWPQNWFFTVLRLGVYYTVAMPATYLMAAPKILGRENLRGLDGPCLVISNHITYLDIAWVLPALPARFRNRLATAMRAERLTEMRHPPVSSSFAVRAIERLRYALVVALFNVFPLPQRSGFLTSFRFAGDLADRGWNILVFPEGELSDGTVAPFRGGIGLLAKQLNVPVVPMYIGGLADIKRYRRRLNRPGTVRVTIGKPVRFVADAEPETITRDLERRVRDLSGEGSGNSSS